MGHSLRTLLGALLLWPVAAHAGATMFRLSTTSPSCPEVIVLPEILLEVWLHPARGGELPRPVVTTGVAAEAEIAAAAENDDVFAILRFTDLANAEAAAARFCEVIHALGLGPCQEDPLGGGIATTGDDGFLQGVFRDAEGRFIAGREHAAQVRQLDILLAPASPEQRRRVLNAVRVR